MFPVSGSGLDVASALLFCPGLRTSAGFLAFEIVQRAGELFGFNSVPDPGFFSPFPPICITGVEDILLACFRRRGLLLCFPDTVR